MNNDTYTIPLPPAPVADLSRQVVSLARDLDRLPDGYTYLVTINKPDTKALGWRIEIVREEFIKRNFQFE